MSSNSVRSLDGLKSRMQAVTSQATRLRTMRDLLVEDRKIKLGEIERLTRTYELCLKVVKVFQSLMDRLVDAQVKSVESVVTKGLKSIFHDQDLSFLAEVSQKRNRVSVDFSLCSGDLDAGGHKGHPLEAFGGGPASFASLTLRIATLLRLKRTPILLLDETLAAISDDYIDATGQFLQKLAHTSGIDILLVTHKTGYLDHANVAYQGTEGVDGNNRWLEVKKLK